MIRQGLSVGLSFKFLLEISLEVPCKVPQMLKGFLIFV